MHRKPEIVITILVTGGIGSGKSEVCRILSGRGIPVYDSDSRTKALYDNVPGLSARVDDAFGGGLLDPDGHLNRKRLASLVFGDGEKLRLLESIIHPEVVRDFLRWRDAADGGVVVLESAIAANLSIFNGIYDYVILVDAPLETRIARVCSRDSSDRDSVIERISKQRFDGLSADAVVINDSSLSVLTERTGQALEKVLSLQNEHKHTIAIKMKTDLSKILAVSGQHGLYQYIAQARNGAIAESLADGKRTIFDIRSRITTLADIAIYTSEGELRLKDVFKSMHEILGDEDAPSAKASSSELKALFAKAVPDYDEDRFYVSHMKKVVEWYNDLKNNASLDFVEEEEAEEATQEQAND